MFDPDAWIRVLLLLTFAVVSMSALACAVALVRDTTGRDWYATGKLTVAELLIGFVFDVRSSAIPNGFIVQYVIC